MKKPTAKQPPELLATITVHEAMLVWFYAHVELRKQREAEAKKTEQATAPTRGEG